MGGGREKNSHRLCPCRSLRVPYVHGGEGGDYYNNFLLTDSLWGLFALSRQPQRKRWHVPVLRAEVAAADGVGVLLGRLLARLLAVSG